MTFAFHFELLEEVDLVLDISAQISNHHEDDQVVESINGGHTLQDQAVLDGGAPTGTYVVSLTAEDNSSYTAASACAAAAAPSTGDVRGDDDVIEDCAPGDEN